MFTKIGLIAICLLIFTLSLTARPQLDHDPNQSPGNYRTLDYMTYIDANDLLIFATNRGGLAQDWAIIFGHDQGLYFPYQGTCASLPSDRHMVVYPDGLFTEGRLTPYSFTVKRQYHSASIKG
jgi:hypothetical protein